MTVSAKLRTRQSPAAPSQSEAIKRIAGQANAVAALLEVMDLLPGENQQQALTICAAIAGDVNHTLLALTHGGAND